MRRKTVLSVGYEPALISGRSAAFQRAGYKVLTANNVNAALNSILTYELDLLLLCHTIPETQQERLIRAVQQYRPRAKVCILSRDNFARAA